MKKLVLVLALTAAVSGCVPLGFNEERIAGTYGRAWWHSYTELTLAKTGEYSLETKFGLSGEGIPKEVGEWEVRGSEVYLHPTSDTRRAEFEQLRSLRYSREKDGRVLSPFSKGADLDSPNDIPFCEEPNLK